MAHSEKAKPKSKVNRKHDVKRLSKAQKRHDEDMKQFMDHIMQYEGVDLK